MDYDTFKSANPGSYAGWGDTEARADYAKTQGSNQAAAGGYPGAKDLNINNIGGSAVDFANTLNSGEDQAYNSYLQAAKAQQTPLQMYTGLEDQAGIPQLRNTSNTLQGQVNDLEQTIRRVEPNVAATTQNSLVTEGQRQGMVNAQKYPLEQQLAPISEGLGNVQQSITNKEAGINNLVGYGVQSNAQQLAPYTTRLQMMADRASRLMSGFTADRQNQLQLLTAQFQAGQQLKQGQLQQMYDLQKLKAQYDSQMAVTAQKLKYLKTTRGGSVYDTDTGTFLTSPNYKPTNPDGTTGNSGTATSNPLNDNTDNGGAINWDKYIQK